ncbi:hypothetical protein [Glycomyces paridis]|uniref:Uncharacterized protein n=1 Tax=Glycomyces paridis TaxID=2126555 RepID=A0A4S8P8V3_9ACTN|nr:hypothetical protein [Glycomyces paridis]THV24414.1 hypothetical protein E9998_21570 [Glycomyces paridis]
MNRRPDPAEAAPIALRDITIRGHALRVSASPVNFTVTVFELPDRITPVYLGHLTGIETGSVRLQLVEDADWADADSVRRAVIAAALGFWRQVRNLHLRSLGTLGLPILSAPVIDGRVLRLCELPGRSCIRATFASVEPHYVGIVADLHTGVPRFVGAAEHLDWAKTGGRIRRIVDEAVLAYQHRDRSESRLREVPGASGSVA